MDRFFSALKNSLEANSKRLLRGRIFLPAYLKKRRFTKYESPRFARQVANRLSLRIEEEISNPFSQEFEMGWKRQMVDFVIGDPSRPRYFFEVESLDRAQLYLFLPHGGRKDHSKLWYYWATVCKRNSGDRKMPRYFVWLLILPDQPIVNFPFWDAYEYHLFSRKLRPLVQANPFSFYDRLIKTSAQLFLRKQQELIDPQGKWQNRGCLQDYQDRCELVFLTCTGRQLIMSRGRDGFDPAKEKRVLLKWKR